MAKVDKGKIKLDIPDSDQDKFNLLLTKLEDDSFVVALRYERTLNMRTFQITEIRQRTEEELFELCDKTFKYDRSLVRKAFDIIMDRIRS